MDVKKSMSNLGSHNYNKTITSYKEHFISSFYNTKFALILLHNNSCVEQLVRVSEVWNKMSK